MTTAAAEKIAKHTPGPWSLSTVATGLNKRRVYSEDDVEIIGAQGRHSVVCTLFRHNHGGLPSGAVDAANARLIAAAPTLLERIKSAASQLESGVDPLQVAQQLRAVLALAAQS